jgi:hypothetical protein
MANMKVKPWQWKKIPVGRVGRPAQEPPRIGQIEMLESRQMLSAFHPVEAKFQWAGASKRSTTEVRFGESGDFLGASGPEAGLHSNGLLGGGSRDPNRIVVNFSGSINAKTVSAADISITGDFDPADPFRVFGVRAKKSSLTITTIGSFADDAGSDLTFQINNIQGAKSTGVWMDPWSITLDITSDQCASNCTNEPPRVVEISPSAGANLGVGPTTVFARFSEDVQASSMNSSNFFVVSSGIDGAFGTNDDVAQFPSSVTYDAATDRAQLTFANPLAGGNYQVRLRGAGSSPIIDLQGVALDGDGNTIAGGDFVSTFGVSAAQNPPPRVIAVDPAADSTAGSSPAFIAATFSEPMLALTVTNASNFQLIRSTNDTFGDADDTFVPASQIQYVANPPAVRFFPANSMTNGLYRIRLSGSMQDVSGLGLDGDGNGVGGDQFTSTFRVVNDSTPPTVVAVTPSANAVLSQSSPSSVVVQFSEAMAAATVTNSSSFVVTGSGGDGGFSDGGEFNVAGTISYNSVTNQATFQFTGALANDMYRVQVVGTGGAQDAAGNFLDGDANGLAGGTFASTFVVAISNGSDQTPPSVLSVVPTSGALLTQPFVSIDVVFSEEVVASSVTNAANFRVMASGGDQGFIDGNEVTVTPSQITFDAATRTARFVLGGRLPNDFYQIRLVANALRDLAGNRLDGNGDGIAGGDFTSSFRVAIPLAPDPNPGSQKDPYVGGDPPDCAPQPCVPAPDTFGSANPPLDISSISGFADSENLYLNVRYNTSPPGTTIEAPSAGEPNSVFGFIDVDIDQDQTTGLPVDRTPMPISGTPGVGVEFAIDIGSEARHPGFVEVHYTGLKTPLVGDIDFDGDDDLVIFRPQTGEFIAGENSAGKLGTVFGPFAFGSPGETPILGAWDPRGGASQQIAGAKKFGTFDPTTSVFKLDLDGDGRLDMNEDTNGNGRLDCGLDLNCGTGDFGDEDVDGDGRLDQNETFVFGFSVPDPTDQPVVMDLDGDGFDEIGVYRPGMGQFIVDSNGNYSSADDAPISFGPAYADNVAAVGDWNFNGKVEVGVFVRGERDVNGDSVLDPAEDLNGNRTFDTTTGFWFLDRDGNFAQDPNEDANGNGVLDLTEDLDNDSVLDNDGPFSFGMATDTPLVGAWNVVGRDDIGVHRTGTNQFFLDVNGDRAVSTGEGPFAFGVAGDRPLAGAFGFTNKSSIGVYRATTFLGSSIGGDQFFIDTNGNRVISPDEKAITLVPQAPVEFLSESFTVKVPRTQISNDEGIVRFQVTTGPFAGFTDEAPNPDSGTPADSGVVTPLQVVGLNFQSGETRKLTIPLATTLPKSTIAIPASAGQPAVAIGTVGLEATLDGGDSLLAALVDPQSVRRDTVLLIGSGGDDMFNDGNEITVSANQIRVGTKTRTNDTIFFDLTGVSLQPDLYQFVILGDDPVRDLNGIPLDGEFLDRNGDGVVENADLPSGDGMPQGDFIATFRLDEPPEIISFRLTRPTDQNVDPPGTTPGDTGVIGDGLTNTQTPNFVGVVSDDRLPIIGDLPGDTFGSTPVQADLLEASAEFNQVLGTLHIGLRFTGPVGLASSGAPVSVHGFIDIDADRDSSTGATGWVLDLDGDRTTEFSEPIVTLGRDGDVPVVGKWDAMGGSRLGVYRPSTGEFFLDIDGDGSFELSEGPFATAMLNATPVVGDFDGDGDDEVGVFSGGVWRIDLNGDRMFAEPQFAYGGAGTLPVVGNWDGRGADEIGVFTPGTASWLLDRDANRIAAGDVAFAFGAANQVPVVGDWNGDRRTKVGTHSPQLSEWRIDINGNTTLEGNEGPFVYGDPRSIAVIGDWDGDRDDDIGTFNNVGLTNPGFGRWIIDADGGRTLTAVDGPFSFGLAGEDRNGDGILQTIEDTNNNGVLDPPDLPATGKWELGGIASLRDQLGVFRPRDASHVTHSGTQGRADLGLEYYVDLGSESGGVVNLIDARTNAIVQGVPIRLFPDSRTVVVDIPLAAIPETPTGEITFGAIVGSATEFTDQLPEQPRAAFSAPSLLVEFAAGADGVFNDGTTYTQGFGTFTLTVPANDPLPETPVNALPNVVRVRATDSFGSSVVLTRGVRVDLTPPVIVGFEPPDNTQSREAPRTIRIQFNNDDLNPATVTTAASYRLLNADGQDQTDKISQIEYNSIDDEVVITLGQGLTSGFYTFVVLGSPGGVTDAAGNPLDGEPGQPSPFPTGDGMAGGNFTTTFLLNFGPPRVLSITAGSPGSVLRSVYDLRNEDVDGTGDPSQPDLDGDGQFDLGVAPAPPRSIIITFDQPIDPATVNSQTVFLTRTRTVDQITGLVSRIGDGDFDPFSDRVTGTAILSADGRTLTFTPDPQYLDPDGDGVVEGLEPDHYRFSLMGGAVLNPQPTGQRNNIDVSCDDFRDESGTRVVIGAAVPCRTDNRDATDAPGYQGTTAIDLFVTNPNDPRGATNLLILAAEDRGELFNPFDDEIAVYTSSDSGVTWSKDPFFTTAESRTVRRPSDPTAAFTFPVATKPSVTFDSLGTAYVSYLLSDLPNVPDFDLSASTRFQPDSTDPQGPDIVDVVGTFDAATYFFEIGFSEPVTPPTEGLPRPLFGRMEIDVDQGFGKDGVADFFLNFDSQTYDATVQARFISLVRISDGAVINTRVPIEYIGDRVRIRMARSLVDVVQSLMIRPDFRVLVSTTAGGATIDQAPNVGSPQLPGAENPEYAPMFHRAFQSSAVVTNRALRNGAGTALVPFQATDMEPVSVFFNEDRDNSELVGSCLVTTAFGPDDFDLNGNARLDCSRFINESPWIVADKTTVLPDGRTPNSTRDFVYVAFVEAAIDQVTGELEDRRVFVARSGNTLDPNSYDVTRANAGFAQPNTTPNFFGQFYTFNSIDPNLVAIPAFLQAPASIGPHLASPRVTTGTYGQVYVLWEVVDDTGTVPNIIRFDRSYDSFYANIVSDFQDPTMISRDDTPFNTPTGVPPGTLPPPPTPTSPIVWRGSNWLGTDIALAQTPVNGYRDLESDGFNPVIDPKTRIPLCDNGQRNCYSIAAQPSRGITANASIAVDRSNGPFNGRLYATYVGRRDPADPDGHDDTDIFVTFSDDNGLNWSTYATAFPAGTPNCSPTTIPCDKVNDDLERASQFNPSISVDPVTGDVYLAWYDTRNDVPDFVRGREGNRTAQLFFAVGRAETAGITFLQNQIVSTRPSDQSLRNAERSKFGYGDYTGIVGAGGIAHPAWTDTRLILADNQQIPQVEHAIADIFTALIDVKPAFDPPQQTPALTDLLGNPLDGEALEVSDDAVGIPSGDGDAGGNFVSGFVIADRFVFGDSSFEEDPLFRSTGEPDRPFPTLQRAIGQANSIEFTITFAGPVALPSASAADPNPRVIGFIDLDVDQNSSTPAGNNTNLSNMNRLGAGPSGLGADFYIDFASEVRHPSVVDLVQTTTRRVIATLPIRLAGPDPANPNSIVVQVPRPNIQLGDFIPDFVNFAIVLGTDTNGNGTLEPSELDDKVPNQFTAVARDHFLAPDPAGDTCPIMSVAVACQGRAGTRLDVSRVVVDFVPTAPVVVRVLDGRTPGGQPIPYVVQPVPGGLNGTITIGPFTDVEFDAGVVVKMRAANLDVAGTGANIITRGDISRPVTFTSLFNDALNVGGDTNQDLDNTTPRRGDYGGLVFRTGTDDALSLVNFARVEFAGGVVPRAAVGGLDVDVRPEPITMKSARPAVVNSIIEFSGSPVAGFLDNAQAAMSATPDSFTDDTVLPSDGTGAGQRGPLIRNVELRDNSINGLLVQASHDTGETAFTSFTHARWDDPITHVLTSLMRITQGTELMIDPGMVVKNRFGAIQVDGRGFLRVGSDDNNDAPVTFTSIFDDDACVGTSCDTNDDGFAGIDPGAVVPGSGDWGSIFTISPPARFNLAVAENGLEQRVIAGPGPIVTIDEAVIRFAGGQYVDNQVPSLGLVRSALQFETPGYYQVTNTLFDSNGFPVGGVVDVPFLVYANVLRADIPFDIATTLVDEEVMNEDPLFRNLTFTANELNSMEVLPISPEFGSEAETDAPTLLNRQFIDIDADGRLSLSDGIDGLWNDTGVVHVVRGTVGLPGRQEVPNAQNITGGCAARFAPCQGFGVETFFGAQEFRDRVLKVGRVDRADWREIDFETDPFGAPLSNNQIIDPELFNVSPYNISIQPLPGGGDPQIQGLLTDQGEWDTFPVPGGCAIDGPEPRHVPSSGDNSLGGRQTGPVFGTSDAFRLVMNQTVYAFGMQIIQGDFTNSADESIEVLVRDPSGVTATFRVPTIPAGPSGYGFVGFVSAFPITEIRINEEVNSEEFCTTAFGDLDDVSYDDFVFSTTPVYPFVPTATQPSAVLTLNSLPIGTDLKTPFNVNFETLRDAESLVVKLSGAAPGVDTTTAGGAWSDHPSQQRANVGAGFQVGMDDGVDNFFHGPDGQSNATLDWGLGASLRLLGVPGSEATGQGRVPVILTSLTDDREGPKGVVCANVLQLALFDHPCDTDANGLLPQINSLTGVAGAPTSGDWGDIFIGARSAGDRDDLLVSDLLGNMVRDAQAIPGRSESPENQLRENRLTPEMDETQGSVVLDARIKYGAKIRVQGASQISNLTNPFAFGQLAPNGRADCPNGALPISPATVADSVAAQIGCTAEDSTIVIAHNEILNMRDAGVVAHPGYFLAADVDHDDWNWVPASPMVFNNVIAFVPQLNRLPQGTAGSIGVQVQGSNDDTENDCAQFSVSGNDGAAGVVMHNTFFNLGTSVRLGPDAASLAINNIISNPRTNGVDILLRTTPPGCPQADAGTLTQAGFNLFFNPAGATDGQNNIIANQSFTGTTLFLNTATADFRLLRFSPTGQPNPAIDSAIGEYAPSTPWSRTIDDTIVRLPLPQTVFNTSPLGPEKDLYASVRQDDVAVPNPPPQIGAGAEVFFDMGAVESRDFGAPFITDARLVLGTQTSQLVPSSQQDPVASEVPGSIEVVLSEDVDVGTLSGDSVQLIPAGGDTVFQGTELPVNILLSFDPTTNILTISPAVPLAEDRYRLILKGVGASAITDLDGVRLDGEFAGMQPTTGGSGYPTGNGLPGGDYTATFRIGIAPQVRAVTVIDSRSAPQQQIGPPRGVDADFFPDSTEFQVDNPPTIIRVEFTEDVIVPAPGAFRVLALGPDGQPFTADDIVINGSYSPAPGALTRTIEFQPTVQGTLPTNTIWFIDLAGSGPTPIVDAIGIVLDGEFFSGNEDLNRNAVLDPGEDRNGNGLLDSGPDPIPSGNGVSGGNFRGYFQVGDVGTPTTDPIVVDSAFTASLSRCPDLDGDGLADEVGTPTCPFNTIQEAIDKAAEPGVIAKLIEVLRGTYFENVLVESRHNGITLTSRDGDAVTIIEVAAGRTNADGVPVDTARPPLTIRGASDFRIEGFQITSGNGTGVVVELSDAGSAVNPVTIAGNTIFGNVIGAQAILGPGKTVRFENNVIWANRGPGIEVRGRTGDKPAEVVNNTIVFNVDGIRLVDTGAGIPNIANVFNNIIVGSDGAGIRSVNTAGATIDFNNVYQNLGGQYVNTQQIGTHNISADPLFLIPQQRPATGRPDPLQTDWRLGSFSTLIDAGLGDEDVNQNGLLDTGEDQNANGVLDVPPVRDHDDNVRFDDSSVVNTGRGLPTFVDIGAFERQSASTGAPGSRISSRVDSRDLDAALAAAYDSDDSELPLADDLESNKWADLIDSLLDRGGLKKAWQRLQRQR